MQNKVISILFCIILASGIILSAALPDRYYSETEKRTLKQFPAVTLINIRSGRFGDDIEKYLADQFPGRNYWVTVKTLAERFSGKTEIGGVYFSKNNYLIETNRTYDKKQAVVNLTALKQLSDALNKNNVPMNTSTIRPITIGQVLVPIMHMLHGWQKRE